MKRLYWLLIFSVLTLVVSAQVKYVFYFIGDGMGCNQVLSTEMYLAEVEGFIGQKKLRMTTLPYTGQIATFSASSAVADSGAAGTTLASGKKTNNSMIGQTPDSLPAISIASLLKKQGWGVGITTTVTLDHPTPAAFYAHTPSRYDNYEIGRQLSASGFDFFAGGGFSHPEDRGDVKAPNLYDLCEQECYFLADGYSVCKANIGKEKIILLPKGVLRDRSNNADALPYAIDRSDDDLSLKQITEIAIEQLQSHERFFLMVEGGKIDYTGHGNDAGTMLREVVDFDDAIDVAYQFYLQHPDETLIVVTADHETGGLTMGTNGIYALHLKVFEHQQCSSDKLSYNLSMLQKKLGKELSWDQVKDFLKEQTGLYKYTEVSEEEDVALQEAYRSMMLQVGQKKTLYEEINALASQALLLLNKKSLLGWTTHGHSASAVPVFAIGVGAEQFTGWMDNSEIAPRIYQITR